MTNCSFEPRTTDYAFGELAGPERAQVDAHLGTCASCRKTLSELRLIASASLPQDFPALDTHAWKSIELQIKATVASPSPFQGEGRERVPNLARFLFPRWLAPVSASLAAAALVFSLHGSIPTNVLPLTGEGKGGDAQTASSTTRQQVIVARAQSRDRVYITLSREITRRIRPSVPGEKEIFIPVDSDGNLDWSKAVTQEIPSAQAEVALPIVPVSPSSLASNPSSSLKGEIEGGASVSPSSRAAGSPSPLRGEEKKGGGSTPRPLILRRNRINPSLGEKVNITVNLPRPGKLLIRIFAPTGDLIATLADAETQAGDADLSWNGQNSQGQTTASGIYFLSVEGPGLQAREKIVVVR